MIVTPHNVLFLCTGNSARSIMAEALLNHMGQGRFKAYSAGSHPTGKVNPFALEQIALAKFPTDGLRSKAWDEFAQPGAPDLHFVFTVCNNAAGEVCPIWPGQPITAHWGIPDPAALEVSDEKIRQAFLEAFNILSRRISLFTSLRLESLDKLALKQKLDQIGNTES